MGNGLSGWLAPSGRFYPCGYQEHYKLAYEIMEADITLQRERVSIGYEVGTVVSFDDALRKMDWIVMGCPPWAPSDLDYIFFPPEVVWERTQEQITWFEENYSQLSPKQQDMLEDHIEYLIKRKR